MKLFKPFMVVFLVFLINSSVFGQDVKIPDWIKGTWHNSGQSNMHNIEDWTFLNDSICVDKFSNSKLNRTCLNTKYSDYKIITESTDSLFKLIFRKDKDLIIYEFKLQNVFYSDKPVLTYSVEVEGEIKRQHSTSREKVLAKQK